MQTPHTFSVPLPPGLYKFLCMDNADAGRTPAQDYPALLTDPTTGHYSSTCTQVLASGLAFLISIYVA